MQEQDCFPVDLYDIILTILCTPLRLIDEFA